MQELAPGLRERGEKGDADAQIALGQFYERRGDALLAREWFGRAVGCGKTDAMRFLAINLLSRDPVRAADGVRFMRTAAQRGDAEAAYICGMLAAQNTKLVNRWEIALACARDAAAWGWQRAREELTLLCGSPPSPAEEAIKAFISPLPLEEISKAPRVFVIRKCLPPEICGWLIEESRPRLERAQVYDPVTGKARTEGARSNSHLALNVVNSNFAAMLLRERMAATAGVPPASLEVTTILHYAAGEEFTPHFDFFEAKNPVFAQEIAQQGQRIATFLVYLNDDYEGGETDFPRIGLSHRGRKGDGLLFWNVDPSGKPDPLTFHAGRPPARGEKWIVSQWMRGPAGVRAF